MTEFAYSVAIVAKTRAAKDLIENETGLQSTFVPSTDVQALPISTALILVAGWEVDGFGVCKGLRSESSIPIILVLDEVSPKARVLGIQAGADLVLGKSTLGQELGAHAKALMRRCVMPAPRDAYRLLRYSTF